MKRTSRVFRFLDVAIRVEARPADLRWLEAFVSPALRAGSRGPVDATVRHITDADLWASLEAAGPDPRRRRVACFFLDTTIVTRPRWRSEGAEIVIRDDEFGAFYRVRRRRREVDVVSAATGQLPRLGLMRVLRELATSRGHRGARLVLHGAAARVGSRGVVIAGRKNAGKTSLLVHALRQRRAVYVANDRVLAELEGRTPRVHGIPTIVSVRPGTLRRHRTIAGRLRERPYAPGLSLSECRGSSRPRPWKGRYTMSPRQLCALLRVPAAGSFALGAVLLPHVTNRRGRIDLVRLPPSGAERALRGALFRSGRSRAGGGVFHWFARADGASRLTRERSLHRLAARVPVYVADLGTDAYRSRGSWEAAWNGVRS